MRILFCIAKKLKNKIYLNLAASILPIQRLLIEGIAMVLLMKMAESKPSHRLVPHIFTEVVNLEMIITNKPLFVGQRAIWSNAMNWNMKVVKLLQRQRVKGMNF